MAQRWTLALILICLTALVTSFRVRDLPKSSHDGSKKQESCENCDVKLSNKWHSGSSESDTDSKSDLLVKQSSYLNEDDEEVLSDEDQAEDDEEDFSFLNIKTNFIPEYPQEAFNKLEEKLEIISKSFWSLFGDDGSDDDNSGGGHETEYIDDNDKSDDEYGDKDQRLIEPRLLKISKVAKLKQKTHSIIDVHRNKPTETHPSKVSYNTDSVKNTKSKLRFRNIKHKGEGPKHFNIKFQDSHISEEDDNDDDASTEEKKDYGETTLKNQVNKKKSGDTVTQSLHNSLLKDKSKFNFKNNDINDEKILNKITDKLSKRYKTNLPKDESYEKDGDKYEDSAEVGEQKTKKEENSDAENEDDDSQASKSSIKDHNFATKIKVDIKESIKYKYNTKDSHLKTKQSSKEIKNEESPPPASIKGDKHYSNDIIKNHTKFFIKTHNDKVSTEDENSNVVDVPLSQNKDKKQNEGDVSKFNMFPEPKKIELVQKELRKPDKDTMHIKTAKDRIDSDTKVTIKKESSKLDTNKDGVENVETLKLPKRLDNADDHKLSVDSKNEIYETVKITKSSETTNQKVKRAEVKGDLKKITNKVEDDKPPLKISKEYVDASHEVLYSKDELNLKPITDALHRRSLHKSEFEDFYTFLPTFAPNFSRVHNPECRRHGQILLRQLRGTKLWALNMLDATAKIPSGLLQGNGIQLGDFEQCLASRARVQLDTGSVVRVQGKYCLAWMDVKAEHSDLEMPVHLAQAKNLIKSRIDDPGHFVPRFSTLSWGVCVPSPCQPEDVEVILRDAIRHYQRTTGVVVRIKVNEQDCQIEKHKSDRWEKWLELPTVLTLSFYGIIIILVCVATVQDNVSKREAEEPLKVDKTSDQTTCDRSDLKTKEENKKDLLSVFSLYYTIRKLIAPGTNDDISCIHGIRAIATIALLVAHKFLPIGAMPYTNRLKITEMVSSVFWSWCRAGWVFTDCFLLLSGTLLAYRICSDTGTSAPKRLLFRYLRLTPALLAVVLFYSYVWDNISTGPMWGTFVTSNARVCQEGWWWNMLYVQNYFGFENMCAPQTHQLALDMQLTIMGSVIVWLVQEKSGFTKLVVPAIHIVSAYSRYSTVRDHRLTMLAYHGVSVSQLYRTARLSYTSVLHRSTPYLVGISLGVALRKPSKHGKFILTMGWVVSGVLWSLVWWAGYDSGSTNYRYNATSAAQYAAFTPIAAAIPFAWIIYAVHNGYSNFLSGLFCSRPLVLISRLSYAIYLCQFIIFITSIGTVRTSSEFSITKLVDIQELLSIIVFSTIITLTFVIPMQSLPKFLFPTKMEAKNEIKLKVESKVKNVPQSDLKRVVKDCKETHPVKQIQKIMVHREVLREIPEVEIEYEAQRARNDSLEGILEEEENEDDVGEEEYENNMEDDMVILDENDEEESWDNEARSQSRQEDNELDEWEWTANSRNGAQYMRHMR